MNRRSFLQLAGAVFVAAAIPLGAAAFRTVGTRSSGRVVLRHEVDAHGLGYAVAVVMNA